jgi:hypothetical protein
MPGRELMRQPAVLISLVGLWLATLGCAGATAGSGQVSAALGQLAAVADDEGKDTPDAPIDADYWTYVPDRPAREWLDKLPMDAADLAARPEAYARALESHGILFDKTNGSFSVRGATIHDELSLGYPIEYLVVTEEGRTHEAIVLIRAQPSVISACVEALGLPPGSSTRFVLKDPPPSEEELASGLVSAWDMTTASGPLVSITVSWLDDLGRPHEQTLESLLLEWRSRAVPEADVDGEEVGVDELPPMEAVKLDERGWIFTGSSRADFRQGRKHVNWYRADVEGDVVAIYIDGREVCPFERNSLDGLQDSLYTLDRDVIPPAGTPVSLTFRSLGLSVEAQPHVLDNAPEAVTSEGR